MGYRAGFYALILTVTLLGAFGFGLLDPGGQKRSAEQSAVSAAPLGSNSGNSSSSGNSGNANSGGGNNEVVVENATATPTPTPQPQQPQPAPAPAAPAAQPAGPCTFTLGFANLRNQILAAFGDVVGACLENEHGNLGPNGQLVNLDTLQRTAGGLLVWQQFTNTMRFTNGYQTWDYSACGMQTRLNTQTFVWETSSQIAAQAVAAPGTCNLT